MHRGKLIKELNELYIKADEIRDEMNNSLNDFKKVVNRLEALADEVENEPEDKDSEEEDDSTEDKGKKEPSSDR